MRVGKTGGNPAIALDPQLKAALEKPLERLRRGEAGVEMKDVAALLDQFRGHSTEQLRLARALIIGADPAAFQAFDGTKGNPVRGAPTPERLVRLLSGEAHGLKRVPTTVTEASQLLCDASEALWEAEAAAGKAAGQLDQLGSSPKHLSLAHQHDFEAMFSLGRRQADHDALLGATQALRHLRPGGAPVFSPRVFELMQQPIRTGGPTLGDLVLQLHDGKPGLELRDVPVLLDRLYDLNPFELKQLRRAMAPTKALDAQYDALGKENNPLRGVATPKKLIEMLGGVCYGNAPLPTTPEDARRGAAELRAQGNSAGAAAYDAVAEKLAGIKRLSGGQQRSWMLSVSLRTGIKGVFSTGAEKILGRTAVDRQTGKRETQLTNQVFVRSAVTLNSYTWGKHLKGKAEYGVTLPYVYGAVGNPMFGPRVGVHIPLVASATVSANGTVGLGVVIPTPIPLVNIGVTAYVNDPRVLSVVDPAFDALERVKSAVQPFTAPVSDLLENLRHKVKAPAVSGPVELWGSAPRPDELSPGEVLSVTGPSSVRLGAHRVELALAPQTGPANVQLDTQGGQLTLTLDGVTHALPASASDKVRLVIAPDAVWVQLGEGSLAKGMRLER